MHQEMRLDIILRDWGNSKAWIVLQTVWHSRRQRLVKIPLKWNVDRRDFDGEVQVELKRTEVDSGGDGEGFFYHFYFLTFLVAKNYIKPCETKFVVTSADLLFGNALYV